MDSLKNLRGLLVAAAMVLGICAATGVHAQQSFNKTMIPMQASNGHATDKSCWVRLYDQKNYQGESFLVMGPINMAQMIGPFGIDWESKVLSIETGPKANLTIFDNRNFKGENKVIDPNVKIPELSRKTGFFDDFQSMTLNCIQPG